MMSGVKVSQESRRAEVKKLVQFHAACLDIYAASEAKQCEASQLGSPAVQELIDSPKECLLPVLDFNRSMCAVLLCSGLLQKERAGHTWRKPRRKSRDSKGSKESAEALLSPFCDQNAIRSKVRVSHRLRCNARPEAKLKFLKTSVWTRECCGQLSVHDVCSQRRSTSRITSPCVMQVAQQGGTKGLGDIMAEMTQDQYLSCGLIGVQHSRAEGSLKSRQGRQSSIVMTRHLTISTLTAGRGDGAPGE